MAGFMDMTTNVDRTLTGEAIQVGGYSVQPVARLTGRTAGAANESGGGGGAWLRLTPKEVHVSRAGGAETVVAIADPQRAALHGMAVQAAATAVAGVALLVVARLWRAR